MTKHEFFDERNRKMYERFVSGARYKELAIEFGMTASGVKQALAKYRAERALKAGRKQNIVIERIAENEMTNNEKLKALRAYYKEHKVLPSYSTIAN